MYAKQAAAQCSGEVSTYPYYEDFENTTGGWTVGGSNSDWDQGMPNKKIITGAGSKCWITGGLIKGAYNNNERSYLQSPCFDLTNLSYPYISFKLFCDTEAGRDGANLQYSPDNGSTWIKIGYFGQPEDCFNSGWYNNKNIEFVSGQDGWSGADKTGGQWTAAQTLLPFTGGAMKKVLFRFYFGADDKNNMYDGFAIDDFFMGEAPVAAQASFDYSCITVSSVNFTAHASLCLTQLQWNFNDIASGASNLASGAAVTHSFSSPGIYGVRLTATGDNGETIIKITQLNIIKAFVKIISPLTCTGGTAVVQAIVEGGDDLNYQYSWHTVPDITTATASLPAGSYSLEVNADNTCTATAPVIIVQAAPFLTQTIIEQPACNKNNGSIHVDVSGGIAPYTYTWLPAVSSTADAANLQAGNYSIIIADENKCPETITAMLQRAPLKITLGSDTTICSGETLSLNAGIFDTYIWDDLSNKPQRIISTPGVYYVAVTNTDGCTASDTISVTAGCSDIYFPSAFTPNGDFKNDVFGAAGNTWQVRNYSLQIYNRTGNLLFKSSAPAQKWNGRYKNYPVVAGTYLYIAQFDYNGIKKIKKGTVTVVL